MSYRAKGIKGTVEGIYFEKKGRESNHYRFFGCLFLEFVVYFGSNILLFQLDKNCK